MLRNLCLAITISLAATCGALAQEPLTEGGRLLNEAMAQMPDHPQEARALIERAAALGGADEIAALGVFVAQGIGGAADPARGLALTKEAAEKGGVGAMINLGSAYLLSPDGEANDAEGVRYLRRAIEAGKALDENDMSVIGLTAYPLAKAALFGLGMPADINAGMDLLDIAMTHARAKGMQEESFADLLFLMGRAYQAGWGGRTPNVTTSAQFFKESAEHGDARSMWYYAMDVLNGQGAPRSSAEAYRWTRRSAEAGYANGQVSTAVMLATGDGVSENDAEARAWYRKAALQGNLVAMASLGMMYVTGEGGPAEPERGRAYLETAAEAGDQRADAMLDDLPALPRKDRAKVDALKTELRTEIRTNNGL